MRALLVIAALLAALYGGYWFVGSAQVEAGAEAALARLRAQGWQVEYADLDTTGFPSRFDTTVTDLALASPDGRLAWEAPFVQLLALSYRPNRVIAVWPPEQSLTLAGQTLAIASERLRASAAAGLSPDLPLAGATLEAGPTTVASDLGWSLDLDSLLAAIRPAPDAPPPPAAPDGSAPAAPAAPDAMAPDAPAAYDIFLEAEGLRTSAVGARLGLLRLDGQVALDAPLDRRLAGPPRLLRLAIHEARLATGPAAIAATGDLAPDAAGYLAGTLTLRAENWRDILSLLEASGVLVHDQAPFLAGALEELAGGRDDIEVPVTFRDGLVEALGVVLLQAPRLR